MASFFVNRPIVAMVISIVIVLLGLVALGRVPVVVMAPRGEDLESRFARAGQVRWWRVSQAHTKGE